MTPFLGRRLLWRFVEKNCEKFVWHRGTILKLRDVEIGKSLILEKLLKQIFLNRD